MKDSKTKGSKVSSVLKNCVLFIVVFGVAFLAFQKAKDYLVPSNSAPNSQVQQQILQSQIENANRVINQVNSLKELTVLQETGTYTINYDKTKNDSNLMKFFANSQITLNLQYSAVLSIPSDKLKFILSSDYKNLRLIYNKADIHVLSVEITNFTTQENRAFFGSHYSSDEILSLEQIAKDNIKQQVLSAKNIDDAEMNLRDTIRDIAFSNHMHSITWE